MGCASSGLEKVIHCGNITFKFTSSLPSYNIHLSGTLGIYHATKAVIWGVAKMTAAFTNCLIIVNHSTSMYTVTH